MTADVPDQSQALSRRRRSASSSPGLLATRTASGENYFTPVGRVPAAEVETIVVDQVRILLQSPEIIVRTWRQARETLPELTEAEVQTALVEFEPLWDELFPAEQSRIIRLLVERVDVAADGIEVKLCIDGIGTLVSELTAKSSGQKDAA